MQSDSSTRSNYPQKDARFHGRLARNILLLLLPLTIVPLIIMGGGAYLRTRNLLYAQATNQLATIHRETASLIDEWIAKKHTGLERVARQQQFVDSYLQLQGGAANTQGHLTARQTIIDMLLDLNPSPAEFLFDQFLLLDGDGDVVLATTTSWEQSNLTLYPSFAQLLARNETASFAAYTLQPLYTDAFVIATIHPFLFDNSGNPLGTIIGFSESRATLQVIEARASLLPGINTYFIADQFAIYGKDALTQQLTRFDPSDEQRQQLSSLPQSEERPAIASFASHTGDEVVATYGNIEPLSLGLSIEVSNQLIYSQINDLLPEFLVLISLTIITFASVIIIGARRVVSPLLEVVESGRQLANGHWRKRAQVDRKDEIGLLASSFNQMADDLQKLYLSLQDQVEERTQQITTAAEVAQLATTAGSLDELLTRSVKLIQRHFGHDHAAIFLLDEGGENAVMRQASGLVGRHLMSQGYKAPLGQPLAISQAISQNQPLVILDIATDSRLSTDDHLPETQSKVVVPISIGDDVLGALDVQSTRANAFSKEHIELLKTIANQLAATIQNFRLIESTNIDLREITALYRGSRRVAQAETREEVFQAALHAIQGTSFISAIYIPNREKLALVLAEDLSLNYAYQLPSTLNLSAEQALHDLSPETPTIIKDIQQPETSVHPELLTMPKHLNCLAAAYLPMMLSGRLAGLMILGTRDTESLTQTILQPYASLSELAVTALEKVRALNNTQQRLVNLKTLNEFSFTIATETDPKNFFHAIHQLITQIVGESDFYIALYDADTEHISFPYFYEDNRLTQIDPIPLGEGLTSVVVHTKQPLLLVENTEMRALALGAKVIGKSAKSWLGVPLLVAGEIIGVMTLQDTDNEHRFDEDDLHVVATLASQMAGVIRSVRLLEVANKRALQLHTASEIAREATATLALDELLTRAVNLVQERFDFYQASVFLLDPVGEYAVIVESTGVAGRQMVANEHKLKVGSKSIIGYVTAINEPLVVNDVSNDENHRFNPLLPDTRAEVGIPLSVGDHVLGALDVQSTSLYAFGPDDVEVLQILADQLAVAVANAELFAKTQENLVQHRLIHHVTSVAASSTNLEDALSSAVQGLRETLGDRVAILLFDPQEKALKVAASSGYQDDLLGVQVALGQGITGWVAAHQEPLLVNDVLNDPRYIPGKESVRSELAVPLIFRGELLGVLNVENDKLNAFEQHDQDILGTLAGTLAAIIVNARLSERQRMLFEATNKIRRSMSIETIIQTTADELSKALKARRTKITLGVQHPSAISDSENGREDGE